MRSGWADERPWLSQEQLDELMALVGDRVPKAWSQRVRVYMSHIFANAVENTACLFRLRVQAAEFLGSKGDLPKLTTVLAKELEALTEMESNSAALQRVSEGLRRALAAAQFLKRDMPSPAAAAREVDAIVDDALGLGTVTPQFSRLLDDLAIHVQSGRDWSVQRQMVRGLAALMEHATGKCPGRSFVSSERSRADVGEHGWFHKLCQRFAHFVNAHEMMPPEMRAVRTPSLDGLVNEELKALRQEIVARAG
jgi:hypothetical protein